MSFSAPNEDGPDDLFDRNFKLYRDLFMALQDRITFLKSGGDDPDCKETVEALKAYRRALQSVLDAEASLVKKRKSGAGGSGSELDLESARAEILARLAVWAKRD